MLQTTITIFSLQITLMLMILAGTLGQRLGIITEGFRNGLSKFLMNLILPCSILGAFTKEIGGNVWTQSAQILLVMVGVHIFYILLGMLVGRAFLEKQRAVAKFAILCPNTNFMGMPVISGIYGDIGVLLLSVALFPVRAFVLTIGISYFVIGQSKHWVLRLLKNPAVWAVIMGILVMVLGLQFPDPVEKAITSLGSCTTPLSMILIGGVVSNLKLEMLKDRRVWGFCLLRLVLIPLLLMAALSFLPLDPTAAGVAVMMSALPAGAMTVIYTKEYGSDESFSAACVIFSTVLSIVTIPLINLACTVFL